MVTFRMIFFISVSFEENLSLKTSSINWPISLFWCKLFKQGGAQKKKELVVYTSFSPRANIYYDRSTIRRRTISITRFNYSNILIF